MIDEYRPLLSNKNFIYLWTSQLLSQLTINIMNFLLITRLFATTGSAIASSMLWVAYALPAILVGPFAAASVDIFSRKKILMVTNLLQALTILIYVFLHESRIFLPYGIAFTYSLLNQFYLPAESASLPDMVKKEMYAQANGLFLLTQQIALMLGFALAGPLSSVLGFEPTLYICSVLLLTAFLSVSFLPDIRYFEKLPHSLEEAVLKFFKQILEGYRFIKSNNYVLFPFLLMLALQIALAVSVVNVPLVATQIFRVDLNLAGIIIVAPVGLGASLGAVLTSKLIKKGYRKKKLIENYLLMMFTSFTALIFLMQQISPVLRLYFGSLILFFTGLSFVGIMVSALTFLQEATPGGYRGRVFGNFWFLVTLATLLPVVLSGALSEIFGIRLMIFVLSSMCLIGLIVSKKYGQRVINNGF